MILFTGDTHGDIDIHKLTAKKWKEGKKLTKKDFVIITGDFGLLWDGSPNEIYWRTWLENCPWTTLVVLGNHENYSMINEYPISEMFDGKVRIISPSVVMLIHGEVYKIDGKKIFTFGGATSRIEHNEPRD